MTIYNTFEELKNARKELVDIVRKNGMLEGLTKLLTELYPDKAHFIYELLQNAEDKNATQVVFKLYSDKLEFCHNGSKRDFILDDIDAITNIGQSTKTDDPTNIGKFGVGFKAVYSYTNTPEIHSGIYDFRIRNMLIPDDEGVAKIAKPGLTSFVFPFDNPTKPATRAVAEIRDGLLSLDENSIIFLRSIKEIKFRLPDGKVGGVKVIGDDDTIKKTIIHVDAINGEKNKTYWSKFTKKCRITIDGQQLRYPISIAYKMNKVVNGHDISFHVDSELKGNVCIYFPAVKESSNLHFHINAPFASTVARDSVRFCDENRLLIKEIADLAVCSMFYFRDHGLLDMNVYATVPNSSDFDQNTDNQYCVIYQELYKAFKTYDLILTSNGEYKKITEVLQTNRDIFKLISNEEIVSIYGKSWIPSVAVQSREAYFFQNLGITQYNAKTIANDLRRNPSLFDMVFNQKDIEWFRDWFAVLSEMPSYEIEHLKKIKMILCDDGLRHKATDNIFIINPDFTPKKIINPVYVALPKQSSQYLDRAKKFLSLLGVKTMSENLDMFYNIDNKDAVNIDDGLIAIRDVIEFYKKNGGIAAFTNKKFFLAKAINGEDPLVLVRASECCWSDDVAFFFKHEGIKYVLASECYATLSLDEKDWAKRIFSELGGHVIPRIQETNLYSMHPQYTQLNTDGENSATCVKVDYTFPGCRELGLIKENKLYIQSKILWDCLVSDKNFDHHIARYRPNKKCKVQQLESTAAYFLRRAEWIPNNLGEFCRPCDLTEDTLYEGFVYSPDSVFLRNIGFGDKSQAPNDTVSAIKKAGIKMSALDEELLRMSEKDKQAILAQFKKIQQDQDKLSFSDALKGANKDQLPFDEDDFDGVDKGIKNVNKRKAKQRQDFEEGLETASQKHQVWRYTYVTKKTGPERQYVQEQYHGKCQICGRTAIRKADGQIYFEAINIIDTSTLDDKYLNNLSSGWNTLCLCPNCAAEYRYCQKNLSDLQEQIKKINLDDRQGGMIEIFIILKNERTRLLFTPKHFLALQTAFETFQEHDKKD